MTRTEVLAAVRRALVPALLTSMATILLVGAILLTAAPSYQTRVGVVAVPTSGVDEQGPEYASVVSLGMPAVSEIALSSEVLKRVSEEYPEVDEQALQRMVAVEIVPASGVARVTVTAPGASEATAVLDAVVEEIVDSKLLAPVADFRVIGDVDASPVQQRPDLPLAAGLAVLAAVVVGPVTVALLQALRPRLLSVDAVNQAVQATGLTSTRVIDLRPEEGMSILSQTLTTTAQGTTVVPTFLAAGLEDERLYLQVERELEQQAGLTTTRQDVPRRAGGGGLVLAGLSKTSRAQITAALLTAHRSSEHVVVAVR